MVSIGIERGSVAAYIDQTADVAAVDTTLTAITGLTADLKSGVTYVIEGCIIATSDAAAQDVKAGAGSTLFTGTWQWITETVASPFDLPANLYLTADAIPASAVSDISGATDVGHIFFRGVLTPAADVTLQFTGAQGTNAGTTTISGSHMSVRIANQ